MDAQSHPAMLIPPSPGSLRSSPGRHFAATLAWTMRSSVPSGGALDRVLMAGRFHRERCGCELVPVNWISLTAIFLVAAGGAHSQWHLRAPTLGLQQWVGWRAADTPPAGIPPANAVIIEPPLTRPSGIEEACGGIRSLVSCVLPVSSPPPG